MTYPIFYFAWVNAGEAFNSVTHARNDEQVINFSGQQTEGDFPSLDVAIKNPKVGLLIPGRKIWAWFSWDPGTGVEPIFHGRLVGIPTDINKEIVTLSLIARPLDFNDQKHSLAETLKQAPYWDPIFVDEAEQANDDSVWEARTEIWHIDRVSHIVTSTSILEGEDTLQEFLENEVPYDSVEISLGETPLRAVMVTADISWTQAASGTLKYFDKSQFRTFGADQLSSNWPKSGASLQGGWTVALGEAHNDLDDIPDDAFQTSGTVTPPPAPVNPNQTVIDPITSPPAGKLGREIPADWLLIITDISAGMSKDGVESHQKGVIIPVGTCWGTLWLAYDAARQRTETVNFTLVADVQPILTEASDTEVMELNISGQDVGKIFNVYGETVIGDVKRRSFFPTDRGRAAIEYLIMRARANLMMRARAVDVTWVCRFSRAVGLSGRESALLHDPRLPGGSAVGKVKAYTYSLQDGKLQGTVTIGSTIGRGGTIVEEVGDPVYAAAGYMQAGYQQMENNVRVVDVDQSVGYTDPIDNPNDDGLKFPLQNVPTLFGPEVKLVVPEGGRITEIDDYAWKYPWLFTHSGAGAAVAQASAMLEAADVHIHFVIQPVDGGPFNTDYGLTMTQLKVPTMINLETP